MRVFFDENMPRPLGRVIAGHETSFVEKEGWKGIENSALLDLVEGRFDVLLTSDGSIAYQNALQERDLSVVVLPTNNLTLLRADAVAICITLDEIAALDHRVIVTIDWKGRRFLQPLSSAHGPDAEIEPVPPFVLHRPERRDG